MSRMFTQLMASLVLMSALFLNPGDVAAGPLDDAKAKGLIGEQLDGYVGAVGGDDSVQSLVNEVNAKRKAKYEEVAKKRGAPAEAVAQIAGKKLIERAPVGQFFRDSNGQWLQK